MMKEHTMMTPVQRSQDETHTYSFSLNFTGKQGKKPQLCLLGAGQFCYVNMWLGLLEWSQEVLR